MNWKTIFQGLPVILTIIFTIVGIIIFVVELNGRIGYIEKDHAVFGEFYQRQIDDIKAGIIRIENKIDILR
jgi:hypothetical protein